MVYADTVGARGLQDMWVKFTKFIIFFIGQKLLELGAPGAPDRA